ncbi:hypothetical protein GCM10009799_32920 [Nocardiopsis rhodophaea]|uniref:Uncharacterized protein n=1 Tax=Nocardiopsis rhodophaea TaxID=280238 RepID=A0ABN2TAQ8_9ACTN
MARVHGASLQSVMDSDGCPLFISDGEPGPVHDLTAARIHVLPALCAAVA